MKKGIVAIALLVVALFPLIPIFRYDTFLSWSDWHYASLAREGGSKNVYAFFLSLLYPLFSNPYDMRFLSPLLLVLSAFLIFYALKRNHKNHEELPYISLLILPLMPGFLDHGLILYPTTLSLPLFLLGIIYPRASFMLIIAIFIFFTDVTTFFLFFAFMPFRMDKGNLGLRKKIMAGILFFSLISFGLWQGMPFPSFNILTPEKIVSHLGYVPLLLSLCGFVLSEDSGMKLLLLFSFLLYAFFGLPTSFLALPVCCLGADFLCTFSRKKNVLVASSIVLIFWISLSQPFFYVDKLQPQIQDEETFLFMNGNTLQGNIMTGWFYAPVSSFITKRPQVSSDKMGDNVYEKEFYKKQDPSLLERLDARYVYLGKHEAYDYPSFQKENSYSDMIYTGKGSLYDAWPERILLLLTIDTEKDLPPVLDTYEGIEEGVQRILSLLERYNATATFFVTGDVMEKYPGIVRSIAKRNEVGLHGMHHEKLTNFSATEKEGIVLQSMSVYENVLDKKPTSFRAPGHSADTALLNILEKNGFIVEASGSKERDYPYHPSRINWLSDGDMEILRLPVSHTPEYFYSSMLWQRSWPEAFKYVLSNQKGKTRIVVIGMHSWEFVHLDIQGYETYTRVCGDYTYERFQELLKYLESRNVRFVKASELIGFLSDLPDIN